MNNIPPEWEDEPIDPDPDWRTPNITSDLDEVLKEVGLSWSDIIEVAEEGSREEEQPSED